MLRKDLNDFIENELCFNMADFYNELSLPTNVCNIKIVELIVDKAIYLNNQNYSMYDFSKVNDILISYINFYNEFLYDFCGNLSMYICNDLVSLIKYNETLDKWYPKIIINDVIVCETNSTSILNEVVTIYRGCNKEEFDNKEFGQLWSLNEEKAKYFAYQFYSHQKEFDIYNRIVVKANIKRENIFYTFPESDSESEVIPNTSKLYNITIIE